MPVLGRDPGPFPQKPSAPDVLPGNAPGLELAACDVVCHAMRHPMHHGID
jgi:hypothetical protein